MRYESPAQSTFSAEELSTVPDVCRPRALGAVPRLGLGSRTTVLGWPTIFMFLSEKGIFANAIQNSVARELMPLGVLESGLPRESAYLPGLGLVEVGHTGSTIEGLVHWGMMAARDCGYQGPGFGADADHLPVYHPASDGWNKTRQLIECSRDYSYFTLDVGPVVLWEGKPLERMGPVPDCVAAAVDVIRTVKAGAPFDLEVSLDESPKRVGPEHAATRPDGTTTSLPEYWPAFSAIALLLMAVPLDICARRGYGAVALTYVPERSSTPTIEGGWELCVIGSKSSFCLFSSQLSARPAR